MSIGVIDLPIDDILCGTGNDLPVVTRSDWQDIRVIHMSLSTPDMRGNMNIIDGNPQQIMVVDASKTLRLVKELSFYGFLKSMMIKKAKEYADGGMRELMISNKCMLNFGASSPEPVVYWLFRALAGELIGDKKDFKFGIEIKDGFSAWSMNIACHYGFSFAIVDFTSRSDIASLMSRMSMMTSGKTRPKLIVRMPNNRLDECNGFDGILIGQMIDRTPFVRPGVWQCLDDGQVRLIEPGTPL